jgi:membrane protein YdbS with pleckstrin-like domain
LIRRLERSDIAGHSGTDHPPPVFSDNAVTCACISATLLAPAADDVYHCSSETHLQQGNYMSYIEQSLSSGEKVEGLFRLHWFARLPMVMWIILGLVTFGLTWLIAIYEYLRIRFLEQGVTNKRVILKKGIISRKTEEMKLKSIETVEIDQGVFGRIFGFGTVMVTGKGVSSVIFHGIDDPMSVKRQIESISNPVE